MLVMVGRYGKRVWTIPVWTAVDGKMLAKLFVNTVIMDNGVPLEVLSDRDPQFTNPNARSDKIGLWEAFFWRIGKSVELSSAGANEPMVRWKSYPQYRRIASNRYRLPPEQLECSPSKNSVHDEQHADTGDRVFAVFRGEGS